MNKVKSIEEIREDMIRELSEVFSHHGPSVLDINRNVTSVINMAQQKVVDRALARFEESLEDKMRWLKMGEAADLFTQAMKLPPVKVKKL